ncbi:MAG: hypothetical protein JNK04_20475, partial [Myxococcales bacterium]|nr:hypothetical protein [Myxococcales bacterium]
MGCMRVFAVLAALHGTGCTLLFDESQYLGGAGGGDGGRGGDGGGTAGAGGGGPSVCDDATCGPSPLPVYLLTPAGESVQAKVDAIR